MTGPASPRPSAKDAKDHTSDVASADSDSGKSWLHLQHKSSSHHGTSGSPVPSDPDDIPLKTFAKNHSDDDDSDDDDMASRPSYHRPTGGRSEQPLLKDEEGRGRRSSDASHLEAGRRISSGTIRSTFRSKSPEYDNKNSTRKKYIIAGLFLLLSLVTFTVQTQTAVYIQQELGWNKPYCMLYFTHGSWIFLWPAQLLILRIRKFRLPWSTFWKRHVHLLRTTAQMVETQDLHVSGRDSLKSPVLHMIKMTSMVTTALTIAGGSWYVAVDLTTGSDLTAIYNCSAFFAYAFSIPLLKEKFRLDKTVSVVVAVIGVGIVAYGPGGEPAGVPDSAAAQEASHRALGNIVIGIGSVLYGLYEVLYKRYACPPEGTSAGRGVIFSIMFASLIGAFTVLVLWIPLPILHLTGWETFEWPRGEAAWMLMISTLSNATFSGSFLVLISLTSPVLSSVAALLTIFIVALVDWQMYHKDLPVASIVGGILIIIAFLMLSWSTYREMDEERKKRLAETGPDSDSDDDDDDD